MMSLACKPESVRRKAISFMFYYYMLYCSSSAKKLGIGEAVVAPQNSN